MMSLNNWSREQLILAFNLYCKIGFTKIKYTKPEIIELANLIGRTPSAVAFKLVNFARLDPVLKARGVKGMSKGSKAEEPIWNEFHDNWEELSFESERLLAELKGVPVEIISKIETSDLPREGKERDAIVKVRVNQHFFRSTVLTSYNNACCITGLQVPSLLAASHIVPWSENKEYRMLPENGLCMNVLHHRAFDTGLMVLSDELKVIVSPKIMKNKKDIALQQYFIPYHAKEIRLPSRFLPNIEFIRNHRTKFIHNF